MIKHFLKTVDQLTDRRTRKVLWRSAALTAVLLAVLLVAAGMALERVVVLENARSEERRVGKEWKTLWWPYPYTKKKKTST